MNNFAYDPVVRRVQPSEVDRFLSFRSEGLRSDEASFRVTAEDDRALAVESWYQRLEKDYVVAVECGEQWLGIGGFSRFAGSKLQHKGLIWGMYVTPEARGTGVANLVILSLIEHGCLKVRQLQLTVLNDNMRARTFYERHGFKVYATEKDAIFLAGQFADEALMWRLV